MRLSKMGMKNIKLKDLDEMYPAQDILIQTGQIKQYGSGVYAYDNIPLKVQDNIERIIKENFDKAEFIEVQMPIIQQAEIWKRSGRYSKYLEEGVTMISETDRGTYCLAPTAEEAISVFIENRITSYKQMPVAFYQIGLKFRNEIRNRGYLLRGKEFLMFDLYSFDKDEESMNATYNKVREVYIKTFNQIGLNIVTVAADNGSMGGKNSEEIMSLSRIGEDSILYDKEKNRGLNTEILDRDDAKQYLKENYDIDNVENLKVEKACELGHIFALGTKYSESMNIKFIDEQNNSKPFYMGCYGIGVSRILGLIYENSIIKEKDKVVGFSLPISVTPYYLYIISNDNKKNIAEDVYKELENKEVEAIIDDVKGTIGEKIRNAKILGIPYIAILGNNTEDGFIEIERTKDGMKKIMKIEEAIEAIKKMKIDKKDINV